jgi:hypothetical protein|tara:strand:+ start:38 stop:331 length:294 start_codon:yes stop_codon:yes gene_type:complete
MAHDKQKLDHNILALDGVTDQEYVRDFGVPPKLANTPEINNWLIEDTYKRNLELEYTAAKKLGRSEAESNAWAKQVANKGRKSAKALVNQAKQKRGY